MPTTLSLVREAYATMTVARYEPIIFRWVSFVALATVADTMATRLARGKGVDTTKAISTLHALSARRQRAEPLTALRGRKTLGKQPLTFVDSSGRPLDAKRFASSSAKSFQDAVTVDEVLYPYGIRAQTSTLDIQKEGKAARPGFAPIPTTVNKQQLGGAVDFDFHETRSEVLNAMLSAVRLNRDDIEKNLRDVLSQVAGGVYHFLPPFLIQEALSPIGICHYYRQLYFNVDEGVGPIEQAFTVAPLETLEVVYETVRKQIHEEVLEQGSEIISESATEEKNVDEVSDKVSSMMQRDASAAMSANVSGSVGVWQAGATASANLASSSQRSREDTSRRLKEITRRASERITKTATLRTRDVQELTTTNVTRRVIKNESSHPVSYGLRRVLRRIRVKVQDLGPRLVWQLYLRDPGTGLARSRFVHFRESEAIAVPDVPPGVPPRPQGGTDTGSTSATLEYDGGRDMFFVAVTVQTGADRVVAALSIDSITDLEGGGKDDQAPSAGNHLSWDQLWNAATHTFSVKIAIAPGDSSAVTVNYTYVWEPSPAALDEWEAKRRAAVIALNEEALTRQFEEQKALVTARSKIQWRPANDLRMEERYEVMNRLVSQLFARGDDPSQPTPLEIESFHRYFDIEAMFVYLHPSWWKPRYTSVSTGLGREAYEITAESEPAPLGSSLGWLMQLDGDDRRNEFLNSPWIRVCMPIRRTRERAALAWLAEHVEGTIGYDPNADPLRGILSRVEEIVESQERLGFNGPEWVTVDSTPGAPADPLRPEAVYPIIDEFEVTVPTDGFVYDELVVETS
ncbi:MAG: hypothetical protein JWO97_3856 [Acidobacteria bacterium]|nr:hypothetical protein [Acidobacteriota bacterium]